MVSTGITTPSIGVTMISTNVNIASTNEKKASADVNIRESDEFRIMQTVCQKIGGDRSLWFPLKLQLKPDYARIDAWLCSNWCLIMLELGASLITSFIQKVWESFDNYRAINYSESFQIQPSFRIIHFYRVRTKSRTFAKTECANHWFNVLYKRLAS